MKILILIISVLSFLTNSYTQNFWQQTNGPYNGATVRDYLLYKDSIIFIATGEGLVKSDDYGNSWKRMNSYSPVTSLCADRLNSIYFGISGHLKRSTDGGNSWADIEVWGAAVNDFIIPYRDTIVVASGDNGVFRSFDYGENWEQVNNGLEFTGIYEVILLSNGDLLIGSNGGGVYRSTNFGDSWSLSNSGIPVNSMGYRHAESFCESSPGEIFTGTHNGIYFSSDYGNNWINRSNGFSTYDAQCIVQDEYGNLYAGADVSKGVFWSTNRGALWSHLGLGYSIYTIGWDSELKLYAGGLSNGLHRYLPSDTTWTQLYNKGYTHVDVNKLAQSHNGNLFAATNWWGLQLTTDQGHFWERTGYSGYELYFLESLNDSIICGAHNSGAYISTDTGKTWNQISDYRVHSLFYNQEDNSIYLGTQNLGYSDCSIYNSDDLGQTWNLVHTFEPNWFGQRVMAIHITSENKYFLAAVGYADPFERWNRFYRSTDSGMTWDLIMEDSHLNYTYIEENYIGNLYLYFEGSFYVSFDEGDTWIEREANNVNVISSDYSGRVYLGMSSGGVLYSTNDGITWIQMDDSGLQDHHINDILINIENRIYLATEKGVHIGEADSIVLNVTNQLSVFNSFHISQNYPNPFNPTTTIKYQIPELSFVLLKVYDVLGNEVVILVNGEKPAGSYEIKLNAINLPSGVYFYRLQAGSFVETKKMVLMK